MEHRSCSEIFKENSYNPFRFKYRRYNSSVVGRNHKYGFGNKEEQDELGLNWIDITARNYDAALGRWINLDPLAEQMRRHSPYNYAFDNPLRFIDPDGLKPSDVIIQNKNGEELGRIVLPGDDKYVTLDTEMTLSEPIVVDPLKNAGENLKEGVAPDAVGISVEYAGIIGGGLIGGVDVVHFLDGDDKGNTYLFSSFGGGVGLDGEIGVSGTASYFNEESNNNLKNAKGMEGNFSGWSVGFGGSGEYQWSNEDNASGELYPNDKSTVTWETYSSSGGAEFGAKVFWGKSKLLNGGKPIHSLDEKK